MHCTYANVLRNYIKGGLVFLMLEYEWSLVSMLLYIPGVDSPVALHIQSVSISPCL